MGRRLVQATVVLIALVAAAQFIRPPRANPPIVPGRTIQAQVSPDLGAVLDRSCGDCHSNRTAWPPITRVAPLSWLYAYAVAEGRKSVNFSEWTAYPPERQRELLDASCRDVTAGRMPGLWATLHSEARLSTRDVATICAASHAGVSP